VSVTKPLPRRRGGTYWLDAVEYDSVTTALGAISKPALEFYKRKRQFLRICEDPEKWLGGTFEDLEAAARAELDKAGDRGSTIHSLAEALDAGGEVDVTAVPTQFQGYVHALIRFERDMKPLTLHTEATVFNTQYRYAGTLDRTCELGARTVLLERKTTKYVYDEAIMQVAAYRHCDLLLTKDVPPERLPLPKIEAAAILLLREDGTYLFQEIRADEEDLKDFLGALRLYRRGKAKV